MNGIADGETAATCLSDEALATYVEGRAAAGERERIEGHLSSCHDCYLLLTEILHTEDDLEAAHLAAVEPEPEAPREGGALRTVVTLRRRQRGIVAGALAALAASMVLFVLGRRSPLDPLVSIVGEERLTVARPTGGFRYGSLRSALRSGGQNDRLMLRAAEGELREKAAAGTAQDVHALGVAQLLVGSTAESVRTLEAAARAAPDVAAHHADLGAARLTSFLEHGRPEDGAAALAALDRALALDSRLREARFNRALLLGAMARADEATAAWDEYLALDSSPGWADEARRQRQALSGSRTR